MRTENRIAGWAIAAVMAASFVSVPTEAGPLLDMFSRHHEDDGYSPLHYWLPGIYRLNAFLQPLPADSPLPQDYRVRHHQAGSRSGQAGNSTTSGDSQDTPRGNDSSPIAPPK